MLKITPCQRMISDRFPVASFALEVPPELVFEIACATDPALLRPEHQRRRSPENFFTSRAGGLLRAPAGQATYLLPPEQLRRFAGSPRLYYALGAYGGRKGEAHFSPGPEALHMSPFIRISPDFSGRTLDRGRLRPGAQLARYGAAPNVLAWGADQLSRPSEPPAFGARQDTAEEAPPYDDGYPKELWGEGAESAPAPIAVSADEPPGFEDAPALRAAGMLPAAPPTPPPAQRSGGALSYGAKVPLTHFTREEPPGAEDGVSLSRRPAYGAAVQSQLPLKSDGAPAPGGDLQLLVPPGKDEAAEDESAESDTGHGLAVTGAQALEAPEAQVLTIPKKFEILGVVAPYESGRDRYSAVNPDGEYNDSRHPAYGRFHHGLGWGWVQFTQRSGLLGRVLLACQRRSASALRQAFGSGVDRLLRVLTAPTPDERLAPVEDAFVWAEPWLTRFREAGRIPVFQAAQNEVAIEDLFDPNLAFAGWLGLNTDRALGMLMDRVVNMGALGARRWVLQAITPLHTDEDRQRALGTLGFASLSDFQRTLPGFNPSGAFGTMTHAALLAALRSHGSPSGIAGVASTLDALVAASAGRRFEARMRALRSHASFADIVYQVP